MPQKHVMALNGFSPIFKFSCPRLAVSRLVRPEKHKRKRGVVHQVSPPYPGTEIVTYTRQIIICWEGGGDVACFFAPG
jgi:hypothetical protein